MIRNLLYKVPLWDALKVLGNNKIVRSSYFWLFFVPATAKVLEGIKDTLSFTIFDETITLNMALPFSWQMFYLSSVFFSLGSAVYSICCPGSIKKYNNFNEWKERGKDESALIRAFFNIYRYDSYYMWPFSIPDSKKNYFVKHLICYSGDYKQIKKNESIPIALIKSGIPEENLKETFHYVQDIFSSTKPIPRLFCTICYSLGFAFFCIVLIENFIYVFNNGLL
ncbi:hypothetical protein [Nitrosomonas sp. Nm34]|uniref:hypothetical protein n=1 Tax=Nitrosomonas sp. Nm34 TaxID=1881055 RepID=UPI0008F01061|nr:hypothetical protein [Nitrosomonas sp. Nm34]SFJ05285.1 hypothetical protein SAMN05428978_10909 [Nitrosomonas sp. Nm34]